jgi:TorA maturation chaperone TorD
VHIFKNLCHYNELTSCQPVNTETQGVKMETSSGSPVTEGLKEEKYILGLLKHIFLTEPTKELLQDIKSVPAVTEENEIGSALNLLINSVRKNEHRLDEYIDDLAVEFARLFIGPKNPPAVPYASFYLSESKTVMSDVTIDVRKRYLDAGVAVKELFSCPDDHIAIELEFLQYLTERTIEQFEAGQQDEASKLIKVRDNFLKEHFSVWVPELADNIANSTNDNFYRGASLLLKEFVLMT